MKIVIPYTLKWFADFTKLGGVRVVLSPYDLESLVIEGLRVQPKITAGSRSDFSGFVEAGDECGNPVYVSKDLVECSAIAGFSHPEHGVAVVRGLKNYEVITKEGVFAGESLVIDSIPGAFIAAVYDGGETHVVLASYEDYVVYRGAYDREPVKCSLGFRIATCVFSDERSLIIREGRAYEVGFPAEAVASTPKGPLLRSGEWLLYADGEDLKPLLKSGARFAGFVHGVPAFREGRKLKILESGALVDYVDVEGDVSAWDLIVEDSGETLRVIDLRNEEVLRVPKELEASCWATKHGVLCCRKLWCGLVISGEASVDLETSVRYSHTLTINSNTPLKVRYGEEIIECSSGCELVEERASVLREHKFNVILEHLLSYTEAEAISKPPQIKASLEPAKLYVSEGTHVCGGPSYFRGYVKDLVKPERVEVYLNDVELTPGMELGMCLSSYVPDLNIRALDPVSGDAISLGPATYEVVRIPRPEVRVDVVNKESFSEVVVTTEPGVEVLEKRICCSIKCQELTSTVSDCRLPARVEVKTRKEDFIFNHVFEVGLTNKLSDCVRESFVKRGELVICRDGGFMTSYVSPDFPEIPPLSGVELEVGLREVVVRLDSRVVGRALIVGCSEIKSTQLKPGETRVNMPLCHDYEILIDSGKYWSYNVKLDVREVIKAAGKHAETLSFILRQSLHTG